MPSNPLHQVMHEAIYPLFFEVFADNFSQETGEVNFRNALPELHALCDKLSRAGIDERVVLISGMCAAAEARKSLTELAELQPENFSAAA